MTFNNNPGSKALESVCLSHPHAQPIATQSLSKGGMGGFHGSVLPAVGRDDEPVLTDLKGFL